MAGAYYNPGRVEFAEHDTPDILLATKESGGPRPATFSCSFAAFQAQRTHNSAKLE